jgi:hypothetical protein
VDNDLVSLEIVEKLIFLGISTVNFREKGILRTRPAGYCSRSVPAPRCGRRPVSRVLSPAARAPPGGGHSSGARVAARLARPTRTTGPGTGLRLPGGGAVVPTWSCSRWGLPCPRRRRRGGAPLPHPFTLTRRPGGPGGRSALCGTFPGVAPAGRYPAPCSRGARTFLPRPGGGSGRPAACHAPQLAAPSPRSKPSSARRRPIVPSSSRPSTRAGRNRRWNAVRTCASVAPWGSSG